MKNYKRYLYTTYFLLLSFFWGCGGCDDPQDYSSNLGYKKYDGGYEKYDTAAIFDAAIRSPEECYQRCNDKREEFLTECMTGCKQVNQDPDPGICEDKCDAFVKSTASFLNSYCRSCSSDNSSCEPCFSNNLDCLRCFPIGLDCQLCFPEKDRT